MGIQPGDSMEQRAFATTAGADNGDKLAGGNCQVELVYSKDGNALALYTVGDGKVANGQICHRLITL